MEESPWNLREFLYKKNLNLYKFHKSLYKNQMFLQEVLEKTCPISPEKSRRFMKFIVRSGDESVGKWGMKKPSGWG